jgi:hypothetical protein
MGKSPMPIKKFRAMENAPISQRTPCTNSSVKTSERRIARLTPIYEGELAKWIVSDRVERSECDAVDDLDHLVAEFMRILRWATGVGIFCVE